MDLRIGQKLILMITLLLWNCASQKGKFSWSPPKTQTKSSPEKKKAKPSPKKKVLKISKKPLSPSEFPAKREVFLMTISNDYKSRTYSLFIVVNRKNQIISMKTRNNHKKKTKTYGVDLLKTKIPLAKTAGITLVELQCLNFKADEGCQIQIEYPYNITYGSFNYFKATLKKYKSQWGFYSENRYFTRMHLIVKKILGIPVGIKEIKLE